MVVFPLTDKKAPAVPKDTDWREYKGKAHTDLIGVMIPVGVFVIDVDTYKGASTEQIEAVLGVSLPWREAELQRTMRGGIHYAFRLPGRFDMLNGQDVFGIKGFDTRSSEKGYIATGKGYSSLCLFGSVVECLHDIELWPMLPVEAAKKLSNQVDIQTDDEMVGLELAIAAQPLELDVIDIKRYMDKLSADCASDGDKWLKVMMAIYHQFQGSDAGYEIADEFSKRCPEKYNERENRKRWESLGKKRVANPVTFASVIEMAGGKGVIVDDKFAAAKLALESAKTKDDFNSAVGEAAGLQLSAVDNLELIGIMRTRFKDIVGQSLSQSDAKKLLNHSPVLKAKRLNDGADPDFYQQFIFLTDVGEYMHRDTKISMGPRSFDVGFSRITPPDGDGNSQSATAYVQNRIQCVYSTMYAPQFGEVFTYDGVEYFNTYRPCELKRKTPDKTVEIVKAHVAHLLPDPREQELLISYLAHCVQRPGVKLFWAIILQGVQGDGKSFFAEMMQHVMGRTNCQSVSAEVLDERYTSWADGKCLTFFEEVKVDNYRKYEVLNKLKPYITNPMVSVRRMYRDTYEAINTANYIALTNYNDALPIDDTDRRYCVLFSQFQDVASIGEFVAANPEYYSTLYKSMRDGAGEILAWLEDYPIPDWFLDLNRAPMTEAKKKMQEMAKSDGWMIVDDAIERFKDFDINDFAVNTTKLQTLVDEYLGMEFKDFPKTSKLSHLLKLMGYHMIGVYKNTDRKNQRIYCKDPNANIDDFKAPF